jgi:hypothetical protein
MTEHESHEASQGAENLPEKPPVEEQLPEEGEPVEPHLLDAEDREVGDEEFLPVDRAAEDDTVDDAEQLDSAEETPPASRGQREG